MPIIFKNRINLQNKLLKSSNIKDILKVLKKFSQLKGVKNPILTSGYVRELVMGGKQNDLDMYFTGTMTRSDAYKAIKKIEDNLGIPHFEWDITNKQHRGYKSTEEAIINNGETVTCIGLNANGRLIDPTGYGLKDIKNKILRMPIASIATFSIRRVSYPPLVTYAYFALRAIRFISVHNFKPEPQTHELIKLLGSLWPSVSKSDRNTFLAKLKENTPNHKKTVKLLKKYGMNMLVAEYLNLK